VKAEATRPSPQPRPLAKICGLRTSAAAIAATEFGADYLGFVFAPSKRQIDLPAVASIRSELLDWHAVHATHQLPAMTAVVVNLGLNELHEIAATGAVDVIQLSGDESPGVLDEIDISVFKAIRIDPQRGESTARREIEVWLNRARPAAGILIDAWHPVSYGGTGLTADWTMVARLTAEYPIWLAGGLSPANVATAIESVRPIGVDVSSGVETGGQKDVAKIRAFLAGVGAVERT